MTGGLGVLCQLQKTTRGLGYNVMLIITNLQVLWPEETMMIIYFDFLQTTKVSPVVFIKDHTYHFNQSLEF